MSCFQVSDRHISAMLKGAMLIGFMPLQHEETLGAWGEKLAAENYSSVCHRYPNGPGMRGDGFFVYDEDAPLPSLAELAKLCHCFAYQACEHPEWGTSLVKAWVNQLAARAELLSRELLGNAHTAAALERAAWSL